MHEDKELELEHGLIHEEMGSATLVKIDRFDFGKEISVLTTGYERQPIQWEMRMNAVLILFALALRRDFVYSSN